MWKAALAGALALVTVGSLSPSPGSLGVTQAAAQDLVLTEAKIARIKHCLRLKPEQQAHWRVVEAVLRRIAHRRASEDTQGGLVQRVRARIGGYVLDAADFAQVAATARPLIAILDEDQKRDGMSAINAMGVASLF